MNRPLLALPRTLPLTLLLAAAAASSAIAQPSVGASAASADAVATPLIDRAKFFGTRPRPAAASARMASGCR